MIYFDLYANLKGIFIGIAFSFVSALFILLSRLFPDFFELLNYRIKNGLNGKLFKYKFKEIEKPKRKGALYEILCFFSFFLSGLIFSLYSFAAFDGAFKLFPTMIYLFLLIVFYKIIEPLGELLIKILSFIIYIPLTTVLVVLKFLKKLCKSDKKIKRIT